MSLISIISLALIAASPTPPKLEREFRAAWITPVLGFDWPSPTHDVKAQKADLIRLLDEAKAEHLNAVILHVRVSGDALYPTKRAPWSAHLTGKQGVSPGYDPLAFAIKEAHARGLQLHAWFNPFRATATPLGTRLSASHVSKRHPEWMVRYGSERWINPGIPAARRYVLATIFEVVENYDVDGVHLDDYFYPYRESGAGEFNDPVSWRKYGKTAGFKDKDDWRRSNIDKFVQALYEGVHERKPWVVVGISPFGIWKSGVPSGITGLDAYSEIYADSRLWLSKGWVDYLAPQLYWPSNGAQSRFTRLLDWWHSENPKDRHIWPGLASFLAHRPSWPTGDIKNEIETARTAGSDGHVHFHLRSAIARGPFYDDVAIMPAMPWLSKAPPAALQVKTHKVVGDSVDVVVKPTKPQVRWVVVQTRTDSGWVSSVRFNKSTLRVPKGDRVVLTPLTRTGAIGPATTVNLTGRS